MRLIIHRVIPRWTLSTPITMKSDTVPLSRVPLWISLHSWETQRGQYSASGFHKKTEKSWPLSRTLVLRTLMDLVYLQMSTSANWHWMEDQTCIMLCSMTRLDHKMKVGWLAAGSLETIISKKAGAFNSLVSSGDVTSNCKEHEEGLAYTASA